MGAGVAAAHLIVFIAVASAGTIFVGVAGDTWRENTEAQAEAINRLQRTAQEDLELASQAFNTTRCTQDNNPSNPGCQGGSPLPDAVEANFTNNGSHEIPLDEVTVLVDGVWTDPSTFFKFQIKESPTSNLWLPGETLEVVIEDASNPDVTIIAPHGTKVYRRA